MSRPNLTGTGTRPRRPAPALRRHGLGDPVPATPHLGHDPAIAYGGAVHVVVWQAFGGGIRLSRIDRSGAVMDTPGILVTDGGEPGWNPTVAFDGVNFMVAWLDQDTVRAKRVSPAGDVLDPTSIQLSATPPSLPTLQNPAIAFDGTNYLVIWTSVSVPGNQGDIFGTLVGSDGWWSARPTSPSRTAPA